MQQTSARYADATPSACTGYRIINPDCGKTMTTHASAFTIADGPPPEYEVAMADLERRAASGELSLAQAKQEIFQLRERFAAGGIAAVMRWAAQAH